MQREFASENVANVATENFDSERNSSLLEQADENLASESVDETRDPLLYDPESLADLQTSEPDDELNSEEIVDAAVASEVESSEENDLSDLEPALVAEVAPELANDAEPALVAEVESELANDVEPEYDASNELVDLNAPRDSLAEAEAEVFGSLFANDAAVEPDAEPIAESPALAESEIYSERTLPPAPGSPSVFDENVPAPTAANASDAIPAGDDNLETIVAREEPIGYKYLDDLAQTPDAADSTATAEQETPVAASDVADSPAAPVADAPTKDVELARARVAKQLREFAAREASASIAPSYFSRTANLYGGQNAYSSYYFANAINLVGADRVYSPKTITSILDAPAAPATAPESQETAPTDAARPKESNESATNASGESGVTLVGYLERVKRVANSESALEREAAALQESLRAERFVGARVERWNSTSWRASAVANDPTSGAKFYQGFGATPEEATRKLREARGL